MFLNDYTVSAWRPRVVCCAVQSLLAGAKGGGRITLATRGGRSGDQSSENCGAPSSAGLSAAPAWALLKVLSFSFTEY